ncbi:hypothetical protein LX32DRAFT_636581 [Colletotrichum zoysiae]|uniref:Uncharacterized protein n=1 Tax=Colletotrichum zoysiae TaxID=1216348 RepID=A0AAD9HQ68_9PEZI|nr:hypothetical protein LX32DRAFT_636581 [Colletotrichum zoysiae]
MDTTPGGFSLFALACSETRAPTASWLCRPSGQLAAGRAYPEACPRSCLFSGLLFCDSIDSFDRSLEPVPMLAFRPF